jgi:PAS domain-containing protein
VRPEPRGAVALLTRPGTHNRRTRLATLFDQITALLESTVDAAVVLDGERRVRYYNPAYQA